MRRVRGRLTQPRGQLSFFIRQGPCAQSIDWDGAHFLMLC